MKKLRKNVKISFTGKNMMCQTQTKSVILNAHVLASTIENINWIILKFPPSGFALLLLRNCINDLHKLVSPGGFCLKFLRQFIDTK